MTRKEVRDKVAAYIKANPQESYKAIGAKLHCATTTIANIAREYGIVRQRGALSEADLRKLEG